VTGVMRLARQSRGEPGHGTPKRRTSVHSAHQHTAGPAATKANRYNKPQGKGVCEAINDRDRSIAGAKIEKCKRRSLTKQSPTREGFGPDVTVIARVSQHICPELPDADHEPSTNPRFGRRRCWNECLARRSDEAADAPSDLKPCRLVYVITDRHDTTTVDTTNLRIRTGPAPRTHWPKSPAARTCRRSAYCPSRLDA